MDQIQTGYEHIRIPLICNGYYKLYPYSIHLRTPDFRLDFVYPEKKIEEG